MSDKQREKDILVYLKEKKEATVQELSHAFYISSASIRRDLTAMQKVGLVKRTHGGVILNEKSDEVSITFRRKENIIMKENTVQTAIKYLPEFDMVFMDNSSTCFLLAEKINLTYKTVVTNALQLAMYLKKKKDVHVILLGGTLLGNGNSVVGSMTLDLLQNFKFDLSLTSCSAIDNKKVYENSLETAAIKHAAMAQSRKKILLIDSKKFDKRASYAWAALSDYDKIVTDAGDKEIEPLVESGYNIVNK